MAKVVVVVLVALLVAQIWLRNRATRTRRSGDKVRFIDLLNPFGLVNEWISTRPRPLRIAINTVVVLLVLGLFAWIAWRLSHYPWPRD